MFRRLLDRWFAALALLVLRGFFRSVEVDGRERIPRGRPLLIVANHFNGFVDPVILVHVFGRLPRFLAKASLWRVGLARPLFALTGLLPVHRPEDDESQGRGNVTVFGAAHAVLGRGGDVAIFPEGTTSNRVRLARIRTGAARIALGALERGVRGLVIVPVGLVFDDKLVLRSRALARVGDPIDLDREQADYVPEGTPVSEHDREAVGRLTDEIEHRLRCVSPDYADVREAAVLSRAAEISCRSALRHHGARVPLAQRDRLAQRLAYAPPDARDALFDALARYHLDLELTGLRDHQLVPGYTSRQLLGDFAATAAVVALLAPLAVVGLAVNLLPYWAVQAAGRAVGDPVTKGTVRFLTALAVFPIAWVTAIVLAGRPGVVPFLLQLLVLPLTGLAAVASVERVERARRTWRGWQGLRDRRTLVADILRDRAELVEAVELAASKAPDAPPRPPPRGRRGSRR